MRCDLLKEILLDVASGVSGSILTTVIVLITASDFAPLTSFLVEQDEKVMNIKNKLNIHWYVEFVKYLKYCLITDN